MGSLMAGWNSPRTKKKFGRTLSLTREEIDQYWRNKKVDHPDQVHEEATSPLSPQQDQVKKTMQKSSTFSAPDEQPCYDPAAFLPSPHREILKSKTFNGREGDVEIHPEIVVGSAPAAWWTKTDLAFLNERPVLEEMEGRSKFKYKAQYGITVKADGSSSSSTVVF